LELQLRDAILAMEHSKTECRGTKDRLNQTATELNRSMEHCNELEDIRDELMAERGKTFFENIYYIYFVKKRCQCLDQPSL
tara:strand:+ start:2002 stop:2244 length:243 start_codon:yes stop_codon:yes gene_type:complete